MKNSNEPSQGCIRGAEKTYFPVLLPLTTNEHPRPYNIGSQRWREGDRLARDFGIRRRTQWWVPRVSFLPPCWAPRPGAWTTTPWRGCRPRRTSGTTRGAETAATAPPSAPWAATQMWTQVGRPAGPRDQRLCKGTEQGRWGRRQSRVNTKERQKGLDRTQGD